MTRSEARPDHEMAARRAANWATLAQLLPSLRPKFRRLLAAARVPPEDAEDLVQDSLLTVLDQRSQRADVDNCEAWILGVLRHKIAQYWREKERERRACATIATSKPPLAETPIAVSDSRLDVANAIADLPDRDVQLLWVCYGLELPDGDAAIHLGCQASSVRKLSRRALKRAQRQIADKRYA